MRLGIDFGGTNVKFGIFEEDGTSVRFQSVKLEQLRERGPLLQSLLDEAYEYSAWMNIAGGGLAIKGLVDRNTGRLIEDVGAANEFSGINLKEVFSERLGVPFSVDNDARCYAYGEWKFGAGKEFDSVIVMTLGTGVGCAAVIDGRLFSSGSPVSGVLGGHLSIDRNGPECPCGNKGCLEIYCSASAFEKNVIRLFPELSRAENPVKEFFQQSSLKLEYGKLINEFQENLAIGVVNTIHAYGVNNVILGGGLMKSHMYLIPGLSQIVKKRAWTVPRGEVTIKPAELEDKAACMGAAFMKF